MGKNKANNKGGN
jgi:vacuole membrane protein 1